MARGRKKSDKAEGSVERPVDKHQLIALIKESYTTKERASSITGAFGERVKAAVENGRLNKGVFGLVCKLHRMEELKRQAFIRDLNLYIDMIDESGLWGHQHVGDLEEQMQGEDEDSGRTEHDDIAEANAKALRGLAQLSDEDHADNLARSGAAQDDDEGDDQPEPAKNAEPIDLTIPPELDRRKGKVKLSGSPALAGIDPITRECPGMSQWFPRARGDRPGSADLAQDRVKVPPRSRG